MNDISLFLKSDAGFLELKSVFNRFEMTMLSSSISMTGYSVSRILKIRKKYIKGFLVSNKTIESLYNLGETDVREDIFISKTGNKEEAHVTMYFFKDDFLGFSAFMPNTNTRN